MSSVDQQVAQVEQSIQQAKEDISLGDALGRLFANRDFKKVVLDGFFKEEAVRLVHLMADPNMQDPTKQESIITQMRSIGSAREYLRTIEHKASMARKSIAFDEDTLAELTQGDNHAE